MLSNQRISNFRNLAGRGRPVFSGLELAQGGPSASASRLDVITRRKGVFGRRRREGTDGEKKVGIGRDNVSRFNIVAGRKEGFSRRDNIGTLAERKGWF